MLAALAVFTTALLGVAESLVCDNCLIYNGQQCAAYGSCNSGMYCLYEYALQHNGQTMLKKSCVNNQNVQFDDGSLLTVYNQCVTKTTNQQTYIVKLCNNGNYCNRDCQNPQPLPPSNAPKVTCYSCTSNNGQDCNSGSCMAAYCTYSQQRLPNGQSTVRKGCSDIPEIIYDDGTMLTQINSCQTKNSATGSTYNSMICDANYCNAYCTPGGNPSRDPQVSCYNCEMNNAYDCTGPTCQGSYCIYERTTPANGVPYVRRSCGLSPFAIYPDGSMTQTINQCERKTISGDSYAIEVCNSGNYCDTACNSGSPISTVLSLLILPVIYLLK